MRSIILVFCTFIFLNVGAQTVWHVPGKGFNSCFQNDASGNFKGSIQGMLVLGTKGNDTLLYKFCNEPAMLEIVADSNNIYDVSYKSYRAKQKDFAITYSTYALANAIKITVGRKEYQLSLFDGACDNVIKGIDYEYISLNNNELLSIYFANDVGLCEQKCCNTSDLIVLAGSTLSFYIAKKANKRSTKF